MRKLSFYIKELVFNSNWVWNNKGAVIPLAALLMPVVFGFGGLGVDVSSWMSQRRDLQTAADAAAIAGAWEMGRKFDSLIEFSATGEAVNNGYDGAAGGNIEVLFDTSAETVTVNISQDAPLMLSSLIFADDVTTSVTATAQVIGTNDGFCILSLNPIESGSLTTSGAVELSMPDCGIAVNSKDNEAFKLSGNVYVEVDNVSIVGSYDINGGSADFLYNDIKMGAPPIADPYADYVPPAPGGCDHVNYSNNSSTITLTPGTYCGGIRITGTNDVFFEPGTYIMNGGSMDIAGNGTMSGDGVSFFLTGSGNDYANLDITGGKDISFSAPEAGQEMAGITFFQDRDAPDTGVNNLLGNASLIVDGTIYFPSQELNIGGTSSNASDVCTKIISNYVIIHGTPFIGNDCSDSDAEPIGDPIIRLVS